MHAVQAKLLETLNRVNRFIEERREVLVGRIGVRCLEHFATVRETMLDVMAAQNTHDRHTSAGVATKQALREELELQMRRVQVCARAGVDHVPALACFIGQPRPRGVIALIQAATGMANVAREHERALLAVGLPEGFIQELVAATNALGAATEDKGTARARRVAATKGLRAAERHARRVLKVLDALIHAARFPAGLVDEWTAVSHVEAVASRSESVAATGPSATLPQQQALPQAAPAERTLPALTAGSAEAQLGAPVADSRKRPWLRRLAVALGGAEDGEK